MAREIAVYMDPEGNAASLYEPGKVAVFRRQMGKWDSLREEEFCVDRSRGLTELRQAMNVLVEFLGECRIFVGLSVAGIPYYELEKAGCSVWEIEGRPKEFLDNILEKEEAARQEKNTAPGAGNLPQPVEISTGSYFISLKDVQSGSTGVTSKQVLLPFLKKGCFHELEVVCSHIPPWLEMELLNGNLCSDIHKIGKDEISILIHSGR